MYTHLEQSPLSTENQNSTLTLSSELQIEEGKLMISYMHMHSCIVVLLSLITDHEIDADKTVNLDSLLIQLQLQVTPKWHQFGVAIGIPDEILEQYSNYPADERLMEVLDYWLKNDRNPTWKDVAKVLKDIELHELAEGIMNVYETGIP